MITFERIMGFLLLGMVVWLLSPLVPQIGAEGLLWTLAFLVAVAMACGLLGRVEITMPTPQRWRYRAAATFVVLVSATLVYGWRYPLDEAVERQKAQRLAPSLQASSSPDGDPWSTGIPWRQWSADQVEKEVVAGNMVFVDFTAAWCTVCKTNRAMATNTPEARAKMKSLGVVPFRADLTTENARISAAMRKHRRPNPPLNLIYPPGRPSNPIVLRPNLTLEYFLAKLDEAAAAQTTAAPQAGPSAGITP
jgi:thiol:disulfide interchange protein DsbD